MSSKYGLQEKLDESRSTDNKEDRSYEGKSVGIFNKSEFSLNLYAPGYLESSVKSDLYATTQREASPTSGQV